MAIGRAGGYRPPVWKGEAATLSALTLNPPLPGAAGSVRTQGEWSVESTESV